MEQVTGFPVACYIINVLNRGDELFLLDEVFTLSGDCIEKFILIS